MAKVTRTDERRFDGARLSFPNLFKAQVRDNPQGSKEQFNCVLVWRSDDPALQAIGAMVLEAAEAEWGPTAREQMQKKQIRVPFKSGAEGNYADREGFGAGTTFIRAVSQYQPVVVDQRRITISDPDKVYPGCYVNAVIHAWCYTHPQSGRGVSIGLDMIQFARDGERLGGGRPNPDSHFETIPGGDDTPLGGGAAGEKPADASGFF